MGLVGREASPLDPKNLQDSLNWGRKSPFSESVGDALTPRSRLEAAIEKDEWGPTPVLETKTLCLASRAYSLSYRVD